MVPWRPPTWTGNHFVPVFEIKSEKPQVIHTVIKQPEQQQQETNQRLDMPNKSPETTKLREPKVHFTPPEISIPSNSHGKNNATNQYVLHLSIFSQERGRRDFHGELDNFEKLGSNSEPMGKYVVTKIPWAGYDICCII